MLRLNNTSCCGVGEFEGIQEYGNKVDTLLLYICDYVLKNKKVYYMYSANNTSDVGDKVTALLQENHLGAVTVFDEKMNLNSGNKIKVYMWDVDRIAVEAWYSRQPVKLYKVGERVSVPYGFGAYLCNGTVQENQEYITDFVQVRIDKINRTYGFIVDEVKEPV